MDNHTAFAKACSKPEIKDPDDDDEETIVDGGEDDIDPKKKKKVPEVGDEETVEDEDEDDEEETTRSKNSKSKARSEDCRARFARANATSESSQQFAKFTKVFGETAARKYFKGGLSFEEAAIEHIDFLKGEWTSRVEQLRTANAERRELKAQVATLKTKLAGAGQNSGQSVDLKSQLDAALKKVRDLQAYATKQERELIGLKR